MPRNMPERDEYGRFVSNEDHNSQRDDNRRRYSRNNSQGERRSYSQGRDYDDQDHGQGGWFGDSRGHAEAARRGWEGRRHEDDYDDNRNYASRRNDHMNRSDRYDRDEDDRHQNSGWYGDSRGHAEAARRGWDGRRNEDDYDDRRRYSSHENDYNGRSERYSRDEDHRGGRSGWYGDSRGHSEAARRGWDERRDNDYNDRNRRR